MLAEITSLLLDELNGYIHQQDGNPPGTADPAVSGNIAQIDHLEIGPELENQLVLTVVNVEEEGTLRNRPAAVREADEELLYRQPPLHLNLYLLFSANYRNYQTALQRLAQVLTFFQGKRQFTAANSPGSGQGVEATTELSVTLDLLSLDFEEINHLWGSLGGKQLPSAVYRGRLIILRDRQALGAGGEVREIEVVGREA
jgi:hypothetical protein